MMNVTFKSGKTARYNDANLLQYNDHYFELLHRPTGTLGTHDRSLAFLPYDNVERVDFVTPCSVHREWVRDDQLTKQLGSTIRKETERLARRLQRKTLGKYKKPKK